MARITVNRDSFKIDERELVQGTLSIGRNQDNDLQIDDPAVSGHHAKIVTVFESHYVEDLGSTNGTFVNGARTKTHTLHNGDVLTIGHYQLLFQGKSPVPMQDANATMMIGVSQLQELTRKSKLIKADSSNTSTPEIAQHKSSGQDTQTLPPTSGPATQRPMLKVHHNSGEPIANNDELPDIEDGTDLLDRKQHSVPAATMRPLRKSDTSPLPSLKVIVLAVLATIATFTLLMLFFA
jgi:predicted component of type VI protein secretion system